MTQNPEQFTYHGVPIPEDLARSWNDPNSSEISGFRRGVLAALRIKPGGEADKREQGRLKPLIQELEDVEEREWKIQYDRDMAAWRARDQF